MKSTREVAPIHWNPQSQPFAGGDNLLAAINAGWSVQGTVLFETHDRRSCQIRVYFFELYTDDATLTMPVIANPFVDQFIASHDLTVEPILSPNYPTPSLEPIAK